MDRNRARYSFVDVLERVADGVQVSFVPHRPPEPRAKAEDKPAPADPPKRDRRTKDRSRHGRG
jgi:hypothetical protein